MPLPAAVCWVPDGVTGFPLAPLGPGTILDGATTVLIGGFPAAQFGSLVSPHGNPVNPKMPGFNPICMDAMVSIGCSPTILVEGFPLARLGCICDCGQHKIDLTTCIPTVLAGP